MKFRHAMFPFGAVVVSLLFWAPKWAEGNTVPDFLQGSHGPSHSSTGPQGLGTRGCVLLGFFTNPMHPKCVDECGLLPGCGGVDMVKIGLTRIFNCARVCKNREGNFQVCSGEWEVDPPGGPGESCTAHMGCVNGGRCNCDGCGCQPDTGPLAQSVICSCLGGGSGPTK